MVKKGGQSKKNTIILLPNLLNEKQNTVQIKLECIGVTSIFYVEQERSCM